MDQLLSGIKVLDLTRALAGPLCTSLLSDFGADVVKVETRGSGDSSRQWPPFDGDRSLYFASVNRGKRSIAIDMRSDRGRKLLRSLALDADVLVENFRPGVLADMGLDPDSLEQENPGLVVMSISGFGPVGPDQFAPGLDQVAQGMSGLMSVTGAGEQTRCGSESPSSTRSRASTRRWESRRHLPLAVATVVGTACRPRCWNPRSRS